MPQLRNPFTAKVTLRKRNANGTYDIFYSDGSVDRGITITDGGGEPDQRPVLGNQANKESAILPPLEVGTVGDAISHGANVANSIFNPFEIVRKAYDADTPEGLALLQQTRKAGYVVFLLALLLLFLYIAFKD